MFGQYTEVATVNTNSAKVNALDSKNKYNWNTDMRSRLDIYPLRSL